MNKYRQLYETILEMVPQMLREGQRRLPTEESLCRTYHVSRQTVRSALALLEEEGIITRRQGSGAYLTGLFAGSARNQVALLLESDTLYTYPAQIRDASRLLTGEGLQVAVYTTEGDPYKERQILQSLLQAPPAGILFDCRRPQLPTPNKDLIAGLSRAKVPLVFMGGFYSNLPPYPYVREDDVQGAYALTEHLIRLGHRRIACLLEADTLSGQEKYDGYTCACRDHDLPFSRDLTQRYLMWDFAADENLREQLLSHMLHSVIPEVTAVLCQNDECAWYLGQYLRAGGLQIPEDVSVAGFDHSYIRQAGQTSLTTMSPGEVRTAPAAARLLLRLLKGQRCESILLPYALVPGASCAPPCRYSRGVQPQVFLKTKLK